ncbi:MAG: hypothetical protein U5J99_14130 [Parvularculaceae bacterium]|nr:hypothetical protein [Parvularculaceae bacterium]
MHFSSCGRSVRRIGFIVIFGLTAGCAAEAPVAVVEQVAPASVDIPEEISPPSAVAIDDSAALAPERLSLPESASIQAAVCNPAPFNIHEFYFQVAESDWEAVILFKRASLAAGDAEALKKALVLSAPVRDAAGAMTGQLVCIAVGARHTGSLSAWTLDPQDPAAAPSPLRVFLRNGEPTTIPVYARSVAGVRLSPPDHPEVWIDISDLSSLNPQLTPIVDILVSAHLVGPVQGKRAVLRLEPDDAAAPLAVVLHPFDDRDKRELSALQPTGVIDASGDFIQVRRHIWGHEANMCHDDPVETAEGWMRWRAPADGGKAARRLLNFFQRPC